MWFIRKTTQLCYITREANSNGGPFKDPRRMFQLEIRTICLNQLSNLQFNNYQLYLYCNLKY